MVILALALMQTQTAAAQIAYAEGVFTVTQANAEERVRISEPIPSVPRAMSSRTWNLGGGKVTFDKDGILIQKGRINGRSTLASVPTSTVLFSEDQIEANQAAARRGERTLGVTAMNGAVVDGSKLLMWLRWDDRNRRTWLEGVFELDMAVETPAAKFIGKLPGSGFSTGVVDDRLRREGQTVYAPVQAQVGWGLGTLNVSTGEPGFTEMGGTRADDAFFMAGTDTLVSLRKTAYGSVIVGVRRGDEPRVMEVLETRGTLVGIQPPGLIVFKQGNTTVVHDAWEGMKFAIPTGAGFRLTRHGLLVWTPDNAPTQATLYDSGSRPVANWRKP
ncbi:MAG: hypothetical protein KF812_08715 [Fimbriimonadaceae bacterium]|nr:hypothetical protein [Fimbriimonadaceae bacterium]